MVEANHILLAETPIHCPHPSSFPPAVGVAAACSPTLRGSNALDLIYSNLYRAIDEAIIQVQREKAISLDAVKHHHRQVKDRLASLERQVVRTGREKLATTRDAGSGGSATFRCSSQDSTAVNAPGADSRTPVSKAADQACSPSVSCSALDMQIAQLPTGLTCDPALARNILEIGSAETKSQVAAFSAGIQPQQDRLPHHQHVDEDDRFSSHVPARTFQFPAMSQIKNGAEFLRILPNLTSAIDNNNSAKPHYRVRKRIALAHFYHAYTIAQENPDVFLSWCAEWHRRPRMSLLPKGGSRSVVLHQFAEVLFPLPSHGNDHSARPRRTNGDGGSTPAVMKSLIGKIQSWRKNGKPWAKIIKRFGYGILLLVPCSLTDEHLRITRDEDLAALLDVVDSRRDLFTEVLQQANDLLRMRFFPNMRPKPQPQEEQQLSENARNTAEDVGSSELVLDDVGSPDWDAFLNFTDL